MEPGYRAGWDPHQEHGYLFLRWAYFCTYRSMESRNVINAVGMIPIHLLEQFVLILHSPEFTSMFTHTADIKKPCSF